MDYFTRTPSRTRIKICVWDGVLRAWPLEIVCASRFDFKLTSARSRRGDLSLEIIFPASSFGPKTPELRSGILILDGPKP